MALQNCGGLDLPLPSNINRSKRDERGWGGGGGEGKLAVFVTALLESFRFKDQDNYDIFLVCRKIFDPESFIVLLFT